MCGPTASCVPPGDMMLALSWPVGNSSGSFGELSHSLLLNAVKGIKGSMLYFLTEPSLRVDFAESAC